MGLTQVEPNTVSQSCWDVAVGSHGSHNVADVLEAVQKVRKWSDTSPEPWEAYHLLPTEILTVLSQQAVNIYIKLQKVAKSQICIRTWE
jgi:hypothetical protein